MCEQKFEKEEGDEMIFLVDSGCNEHIIKDNRMLSVITEEEKFAVRVANDRVEDGCAASSKVLKLCEKGNVREIESSLFHLYTCCSVKYMYNMISLNATQILPHTHTQIRQH